MFWTPLEVLVFRNHRINGSEKVFRRSLVQHHTAWPGQTRMLRYWPSWIFKVSEQMKKPLKPAHSAGGLSSQGKVLLYILSEPLLFYLRPIVFCAIILCREDPDFIPSVTFLTGARALLQVPSSHLFSRLVPSVSPYRSGAPDPNQFWNPLQKFASVLCCISCICGWSLCILDVVWWVL